MSWPDEFLKQLDYVIGGVHSSMNQDRDTMTKRMISAIENPYVTFIAHPTNRMINERPAVNVDWQKVLRAVKDYDKILEINAQPQRLDLTYDLVKEALDMGVKFIINTDSHEMHQSVCDLIRYAWTLPSY